MSYVKFWPRRTYEPLVALKAAVDGAVDNLSTHAGFAYAAGCTFRSLDRHLGAHLESPTLFWAHLSEQTHKEPCLRGGLYLTGRIVAGFSKNTYILSMFF